MDRVSPVCVARAGERLKTLQLQRAPPPITDVDRV